MLIASVVTIAASKLVAFRLKVVTVCALRRIKIRFMGD